MMVPDDIHTHLVPDLKGAAIVNQFPDSFEPELGMWYSVGFHPWELPNDISSMKWPIFEAAIAHPQVLAVGEAGLDKLAEVPLLVQEEVFRRQALAAEKQQKPLIIHLVKALDQLLKLQRELRPTVPWIIHGFRGKMQQADTLVRHGFYLSFGEKYQEQALMCCPLHRLLLETDESSISVHVLYQRAAAVRGCTFEELHETVGKNICAVFFKH